MEDIHYKDSVLFYEFVCFSTQRGWFSRNLPENQADEFFYFSLSATIRVKINIVRDERFK